MTPIKTTPTIIMAPLKGYTDAVFRDLFTRHFGGFDAAVAPFIPTVSGGTIRPALLADLQNSGPLPVIPQLMGKNPDDFVSMARVLFDLGYGEVNWNLGCPFPVVMKKGRGCGMMPYPDTIDAFLDRVLSKIPGRLSIKLRLGRKDPDEVFSVLSVLNRYPLSELILHPRTAEQMYGGRPDLDRFAKVAADSRHPVVYNGDINCPADLYRLAGRFSTVNRWMIGRGALVDPFLPALIQSGQDRPANAFTLFKAFHDDLVEGYRRRLSGPGHLLDRLKGFWTYFGIGFHEGEKITQKIHRCNSFSRYAELTERFFSSDPAWRGQPEGTCIDEKIR